jgi:hypothetical protein
VLPTPLAHHRIDTIASAHVGMLGVLPRAVDTREASQRTTTVARDGIVDASTEGRDARGTRNCRRVTLYVQAPSRLATRPPRPAAVADDGVPGEGFRVPCVWRGLLQVVDAVSTWPARVAQSAGTGPGACG